MNYDYKKTKKKRISVTCVPTTICFPLRDMISLEISFDQPIKNNRQFHLIF